MKGKQTKKAKIVIDFQVYLFLDSRIGRSKRSKARNSKGNGERERVDSAMYRSSLPKQRERGEMAETKKNSRAIAFSPFSVSASEPPPSSPSLPFLARVH